MWPNLLLLNAPDWQDYELMDSGQGRKLERFGEYIFVRPEHQAMWSPQLSQKVWDSAQATFEPTAGEETGGKWQSRLPIGHQWTMKYSSLVFHARMTSSRHLGVFPEQAVHWDWIADKIKQSVAPANILNLFGYTGLASLSAAQAGARVTHVDASKKALAWARENQVLSRLQEKPIRWIVDDAMKFILRENRRNMSYDGIIMDPPKFGRGPKGEVWSSLEMLPPLIRACRNLLSPKPLFFVITAYAIRASALSLFYLLEQEMDGLGGEITCGELVTQESSAKRVLSLAIFSRWVCEGNR